MPQKLTRAQIRAGLDQVPIDTLLSSGEGKQPKITAKMKAFAHAVALGETKAKAYRGSYNPKPAHSTMVTAPYKLAADPRIKREVEAYKLAIEAEKHRTPAQLKALLVQQLVQHTLDPEFPPAQRMKALQLIGNLFEVGAFLEKRETTIVHKSSDIRARLLDRLQSRSPSAGPATDALELLEEIKGGSLLDAAAAAPTGPGAPPAGPLAPGALSHTVPDIGSPAFDDEQTNRRWGTPVEKSEDKDDFDKE